MDFDMLLKSNKPNHIYLIYTYKDDLALNNLQCIYAIKSNQTTLLRYLVNFRTNTIGRGIEPPYVLQYPYSSTNID